MKLQISYLCIHLIGAATEAVKGISRSLDEEAVQVESAIKGCYYH